MARNLTGLRVIVTDPGDIAYLESQYDHHPTGHDGKQIDAKIARLFGWTRLEDTLASHFKRALGLTDKENGPLNPHNLWVIIPPERTQGRLSDTFPLSIQLSRPGFDHIEQAAATFVGPPLPSDHPEDVTDNAIARHVTGCMSAYPDWPHPFATRTKIEPNYGRI